MANLAAANYTAAGCKSEGKFLMVWYVNKALLWVFTIGFGKLGITFSTFFVMFSASMTGAGTSMSVCVCLCVCVSTRLLGQLLQA